MGAGFASVEALDWVDRDDLRAGVRFVFLVLADFRVEVRRGLLFEVEALLEEDDLVFLRAIGTDNRAWSGVVCT